MLEEKAQTKAIIVQLCAIKKQCGRNAGDRMRIGCWNCADGLFSKRALLQSLPADLMVVPEVRQADFDRISDEFAHGFYCPSTSARGLAVFSRLPGVTLRGFRVPQAAECYLWLHTGGIDILAVWVKAKGDYVRPAFTTIAHFLRRSKARQRIVLGDFNLNPSFDGNRRRMRAGDLVDLLAAQGLRSLYHQATGEDMGRETRATHHFTYNAARPFHIDFIFASRSLELGHFWLGEAADWIGRGRGDHMPLCAHLHQTADQPLLPDQTRNGSV